MIQPTFIFFGTSQFSVYVLDALKKNSLIPLAVVTFPDKPQGRSLTPQPNPVKTWATENNVHVIEVKTFKDEAIISKLQSLNADVFVVASFGKILPASVIYMPPRKTLNVHPSLLPKLRGASPLQTALLTEDTTGVTIMRIDEKMDEGPIVVQKEVPTDKWPLEYKKLESLLGHEGGVLLSEILAPWVAGTLPEIPQDHDKATYTKMITKEDGDITNDTPEMALRKIKAFEVWPRAFTFYTNSKGDKERIIVLDAHIENNTLVFDRIIPEGKKEMSWEAFVRGH